MQRYFPRLLSFFVPVAWVNPAWACVNLASADAYFSSLLFELLTSFVGILIFLVMGSIVSVFLMMLTQRWRKFIFKEQTTTWVDICCPTALIMLLLVGVIGCLVMPPYKAVFATFGENMPALTRLIMVIPPFLWFVPFGAAIIFKGLARRPRLSTWVVIQLASLLLLGTLLWRLYCPLFVMAQ